MADDIAGIVLEIPPGFFDNIKKADEAIKQLQATSATAARKIKGHFDITAVSGLNAFIRKVEEAQGKLSSIKMPSIDASSFTSSISEIATAMAAVDKSSTTGAARLSRIADAVTKLSASTPAYSAFKDIADGITLIGSTSDATIAKVSALATTMAALARDIRTVAAARSADAEKTATAAQYNKLYKEQADLVRQINEIKNKGSKATLDELTTLAKIEARYREIDDQLVKLEGKKKTAASSLADWQGQLRTNNTWSRTTVTGAIDYAKQAKSLKDLQDAYKNLKAVMATVDPKSKDWQSMNNVLQQTKTKIDEIRKGMGEFSSQSKQLGGTVGQLRNQLAAVFSVAAIKQYMSQMIKVRAEFELQNTALRAILQNKDEADRIFAQVQQMALQSPFTIMQLTTYTKQLAAYRIEASKLVGTTKMLADVSAGLGVDIQRLILAYGQVKSANYLRACLGRGTEIKTMRGVVKVEDIVIGDKLYNDHNEVTTVAELYSGTQQMYKFTEIAPDGYSYRVNEAHILTMYDKLTNAVVDVKVLDYLQYPDRYMGVRMYEGEICTYAVNCQKDAVDEYFGFRLDGNKRFQLVDGTITHNTEVRQFTEAGLNIAGELAQYFSELQGKMISVGDVMDMITKRMVRFEDVEEVFKRVTSAGGIFYDMQKKQSDTLYGQLQRIQDALSLMMNDIGKSNQGAISTMLKIIRSVISNWRIFANVLSGVTVAMIAYTVKTVYAAIATNTFNASQKGLVGALAKSRDAIVKMFSVLAKNPYTILIAGAVAAGLALWDWKKKVDGVRESYSRMVVGASEQQKKLATITDKLKSSNENVKTTNRALSTATKGTSEYSDAVNDNRKALSEQYQILQELRNSFPEVYAQIVKAKDGTVDFTQAVKGYTEAARMFSIVSTLSENDTGWFNDDFKEDMKEVSESQEKYNAQLAVAEAKYNALMAVAESTYQIRSKEGSLTNGNIQQYNRLLSIKNSNLSVEEKIAKAAQETYALNDSFVTSLSNEAHGLQDAYINLTQGYFPIADVLKRDIAEAEKETKAMVQRILFAAGVTSIEAFEKLPDSTKKAVERASQMMVQSCGLALTEIQRDILNRNWAIPLKINLFPEDPNQGLSYLQEKINQYIKEHPEVKMPEIKASEDTDTYFNTLKQNREQDLKDQKQYNAASAQLDKDRTNKQVASELGATAEARKAMMDYFGVLEKNKQGREEDTELKRWQNVKKSIEDTAKSYEEYRKSFTKSEADELIGNQFSKAFTNLGVKISDYFKDGIYDADALISALKILQGQLRNTTSARAKALNDLILEIESKNIDLKVKMAKSSEDELKSQIDEMFANYELTKELGKLGVNIDLTYMVGGKPMTLADIRAEIQRLRSEGGDSQDAQNRIKIYEDAMKKISQLELNEQKERLKSYEKYLKQMYSDRAKKMIEAYTDMKNMEQDFNSFIAKLQEEASKEDTTETRKQQIAEQIKSLQFQKAEAIKAANESLNQNLAKLDWEQFKGSDVFTQLYQDAENLSKGGIDLLIKKLEDARTSLQSMENVDYRAVREITNHIEKLQDVRLDTSSWGELTTEIKEAKDTIGDVSLEDAQKNLVDAQSKIDNANIQIAQIQSIINLKEQEGNEDDKIKNLSEDQRDLYKEDVDTLRKKLEPLQEEVKAQQKVANTNEKIVKSYETQRKALERKIAIVAQIKQSFDKVYSSVVDVADALGNDTDMWGDFGQAIADSIFSCITLTLQMQLMGIAANSSLGVIGWVATALQVVANLLVAIFKQHDKNLQKQIDALEERVDALSKSFEKLEKSIERAFSIGVENSLTQQALNNLRAQKQAYQEMIRLEEAKKKTDDDKIKDYKEKLQELTEAQEELYENRREKWGSTNDVWDEANNWVDAWLNAYKETGDGLDALNESWDEFYENLVKKQAASKVLGARMDGWIKRINDAIDKNMGSEYDYIDIFKKVGEEIKAEAAATNAGLKQIFDYAGLGGSAGELVLSELQKGIQNITEPQAAAIEAYLNSMRFEVFHHTQQLDTLIAAIQTQYGVGDSPILLEVRAIRSVLTDINDRFRSITQSVTGRGWVMKVD